MRKEGENDGVPNYDTSALGHTKRGRKGFPAMTKATRDTQARRKGKERKENYTSIDPKQFQNDSFRPILVKNRFLGTPYFHPKSKLLHQ